MPISDIDAKAAATLDGSQMLLVIKKPEPEKVQLIGTIDGTNKEFTFPTTHYPLAATTYKRVTPIATDIVVYTRKGTTDSVVAVTSIKKLTDPATGFTVYGIAELTAAPTTEGADSVWATCSVEHDVYVQQSIKPKVDQDTSKIGRMGSKKKYTKHGGIETSYDVDAILADLAVVILGNFDESDETGIEAGHTLYELRDTPLIMDGYVVIFSGDEETDPVDREVLGYIMLNDITKDPALPEGKENDDLTIPLKLNIGDKPRILAKNAA
ncbi:hypothetical protein [Methanobacterium sp.]|uniref:hypothetical protein n=1 Tax=Methanobacterium sp. TaxID=2164 RepID=UPI002ABCFE5E|nr:hypothetical protein [Methanobacterium sp.]MDY9922793.1 hypothetical protein [Methanobacterium sp.]